MNTLTVSITNLDQLRHGVIARHRFDCKGGTIGSGQTSWQLDDPNQSVAPIHCEIDGPVKPKRREVDYFIHRMERELLRNRGVLAPEELAEYDQALNIYRNLASRTRD